MKKIIFLLLISVTLSGCGHDGQLSMNEEEITYKQWHVSPSRNPMSSMAYPYVEWDDVLRIKAGMSAEEVENIVHDLQYFHHPTNAIIFSFSPQGEHYEIALKLSEDKQRIIDISFFEFAILKTKNDYSIIIGDSVFDDFKNGSGFGGLFEAFSDIIVQNHELINAEDDSLEIEEFWDPITTIKIKHLGELEVEIYKAGRDTEKTSYPTYAIFYINDGGRPAPRGHQVLQIFTTDYKLVKTFTYSNLDYLEAEINNPNKITFSNDNSYLDFSKFYPGFNFGIDIRVEEEQS